MVDQAMGIETRYCLSDAVWTRVMPLLPAHRKRLKGGRPAMDDRKAMTAILYVLRTGCQWRALPRSLGAGTTVHDRFQQWVEAGVFKKMWKAGLLDLGEKKEVALDMAVYGWRDDEGPVRRRKDGQKPHR
jgi:putative transposase